MCYIYTQSDIDVLLYQDIYNDKDTNNGSYPYGIAWFFP